MKKITKTAKNTIIKNYGRLKGGRRKGPPPKYATAVLLPMLSSDKYVPRRAEHALWRGHTAPSAIEHLQLLDPDY